MEPCEKSTNTILLMPSIGYVASAITLFLIGFLGFFLNLFVLILMWKDSQLRTPINMILFNLVCSDFSVSVLGNPWTFLSAVSYGWLFGDFWCKIYGFFMSLLGISSIVTLSVLAFERYLMVSQPFTNNQLNKNGARLLIIAIWFYSAILTLPPLFGWANYDYEAANISCSVNWEEQTFNSMTYVVFLFVFGLIIPLVIIAFSYFNIIITLKKSSERTQRISRSEKKVTIMVLVMIIAFLVAWAPYAVFALISQFGDAGILNPGIAVIPSLLAKSSICYNPIIYVGMNPQFRQSWRQFFKKFHDGDLASRGPMHGLATTKCPSQIEEKMEVTPV